MLDGLIYGLQNRQHTASGKYVRSVPPKYNKPNWSQQTFSKGVDSPLGTWNLTNLIFD